MPTTLLKKQDHKMYRAGSLCILIVELIIVTIFEHQDKTLIPLQDNCDVD